MRVIINADDLGMNDVVNSSVFRLMSKGRLTSATLMANGPAISPALRELKNHAHASFGVHLNITEFKPLLPASGLAPLMNEAGVFAGNIGAIRLTPSLLSAISNEFSQQIDFLRSSGVRLSHIDSHQHIHTIPALFPVLKYLQRKFAIRKVRITRTIPKVAMQYKGKIMLQKATYNFCLRHILNTRTTDGFSDLQTFYDHAKKRNIAGNNFEIMVHPGSDLSDDNFLLSTWEKDLPFPITLISYNQL